MIMIMMMMMLMLMLMLMLMCLVNYTNCCLVTHNEKWQCVIIEHAHQPQITTIICHPFVTLVVFYTLHMNAC